MAYIIIPYLVTLSLELPFPFDVDDFTMIGPLPYRGEVKGFSGSCNPPGSGTGATSLQLSNSTENRDFFTSLPYFDPNTSHPNGGYVMEGGQLITEPTFSVGHHLKLRVVTINDGFDIQTIKVAVVTRMYKEVQV